MFSTKKSKKTETHTLTLVIRVSSFLFFSFSPYSPFRFSLLFSSFFPCFSPFIFLWFSLRFSPKKADERWATPLMKNLKVKEREKNRVVGQRFWRLFELKKFVGIVWIEKFVSWFWRLMGLRLRWWCQRWSQEGWRRW